MYLQPISSKDSYPQGSGFGWQVFSHSLSMRLKIAFYSIDHKIKTRHVWKMKNSSILWLNLTSMKRNFTLAIPTPCHEKWDQFTPTQKGRFCGSCQKEVIDFTTWSEEQIKEYFATRPASTCGRFAPYQLTTYKTWIPTNSKQQSRWAAALAFILLLVSRPTEAQTTRTRVDQEQVDKISNLPSGRTDSIKHITIRGVVSAAEDTELLPGVSVLRKGTKQGVITDAEGKFEMVIDQPRSVEKLVISFIGLTTVEYEVVSDSTWKEVKIQMNYDVTQLGGITVGGVVATRWYSPRGLWWKIKSIFR